MIPNIKFIIVSIISAGTILLYGCSVDKGKEAALSPVDYVSTLTGTLSDYSLSTGNTYPATALPWGMNFWSPQTGKNGDGWMYKYSDHKIRGFKQTHQPSPWINDYGQFSIMPVRDASTGYDEESRASWFSHKSETAKPYYYQVYLADHDVNVELSPTERAAVFRMTFPESEASALVIDAFDKGSSIKVDIEKGEVTGYTTKNSGGVPENFRNFFILNFDKKIEDFFYVIDGKSFACDLSAEKQKPVSGDHVMAVVKFKTSKGEKVHIETASSFISEAQARLNLKEVAGRGFEAVKDAAKARWNEVLGRIKVSGGDPDQYRTFYSCLYRSTLFPRKFYEINAEGRPVHYSPYNGEIRDGFLYTDTGFWDTFRSLFPLLNLVYPDINKEIQLGLANIAKENPFLPEWASPGHRGCMVGNNSASVIADAVLSEVNKEELETLYKAMVFGTENVLEWANSSGRLGHEYYNSMGYIPYDVGINENVARTLEYSYNDWCILQMAKKLGRPENELEKWASRAMNYKNVFDKSSGLMRGRNKDGSFQEPFSPYKWGDAFTEGNSWHYTWSVFHDVQGLIDLMGGEEKFVGMLDSVFVVPPIYDDSYYGFCIHEIKEMQVANMGNYAHGNQPAQHMIYLYNYAGQPWKTQKHVRETMNKLYSATPDAYCGDEDNGQTSAWYIFSALGFYPVCPASLQYAVGAPLFKKAVISRPDGGKIEITAKDNSEDNLYVKSMSLNGRGWTRNYLNYNDLIKGAKISFEMGSSPNFNRGVSEQDKPYSFCREK